MTTSTNETNETSMPASIALRLSGISRTRSMPTSGTMNRDRICIAGYMNIFRKKMTMKETTMAIR